ncbi:MAG: hypothetical protein IJF76_00070 [Clostridia bacterium]|nr:hypothetical protein [Clostridia bacterium]
MKVKKLILLILVLSCIVLLLCACGECEHDYRVTETVVSTCEVRGYEISTCIKCGDRLNKPLDLDENNHKESSVWTGDDNYHWHVSDCTHRIVTDMAEHQRGESGKCTVCGRELSCPHDFSSVVEIEATCSTLGRVKKTCNLCYTVEYEDIAYNPQNHEYSNVYAGDEEYHWYPVTCGHDVSVEKEKHTRGENNKCSVCSRDLECIHLWSAYSVETQPTCSTLGRQRRDCLRCEAKEYEDIPMNDNHSFSADWTTDKYSHWHKSTCGHDVVSEDEAHEFEDGVCVVCDRECTHEYDGGVHNSSSNSTIYNCTLCGDVKEEEGLPNRESKVIVMNDEPRENEPEYKYYKYKVSVDKSAENRLIDRREEKTYYLSGEYNLFQSSISNQFKYMGTFYPMHLYEAAPLFDMEKNCSNSFATAEFNTREFNKKIHNFIRFIYICTDGKLELSFEYDTSFMYQCRNLSYGIRGRFNVENCADGLSYDTVRELLLSKYSGAQTYLDVYKGTMGMEIKFLSSDDTTLGLNVGDYSWCDIHVGIPLLSVDKENNFWSFMLTNSGMIGY